MHDTQATVDVRMCLPEIAETHCARVSDGWNSWTCWPGALVVHLESMGQHAVLEGTLNSLSSTPKLPPLKELRAWLAFVIFFAHVSNAAFFMKQLEEHAKFATEVFADLMHDSADSCRFFRFMLHRILFSQSVLQTRAGPRTYPPWQDPRLHCCDLPMAWQPPPGPLFPSATPLRQVHFFQHLFLLSHLLLIFRSVPWGHGCSVGCRVGCRVGFMACFLKPNAAITAHCCSKTINRDARIRDGVGLIGVGLIDGGD